MCGEFLKFQCACERLRHLNAHQEINNNTHTTNMESTWTSYKPHYIALSVIIFAACLRDLNINTATTASTQYKRFPDIETSLFNSKWRQAGCINFYFLMLHLIFTNIYSVLFGGNLRSSERHTLKERLVNFTLFKIVFVAAVLEPDAREFGILILWYGMFGFFRMLGKIARDRGESIRFPTVFALGSINIIWFRIAYVLMGPRHLSDSLLIVFECMLGIVDLLHVSIVILLNYNESYFHRGHWEMKRSWKYHVNVFADWFSDSCNLLHYIHIWILNGLSFTLVDAILFLSMKGVCSNLWVQYQDFSKYREAMNGFHAVLRDATSMYLNCLFLFLSGLHTHTHTHIR